MQRRLNCCAFRITQAIALFRALDHADRAVRTAPTTPVTSPPATNARKAFPRGSFPTRDSRTGGREFSTLIIDNIGGPCCGEHQVSRMTFSGSICFFSYTRRRERFFAILGRVHVANRPAAVLVNCFFDGRGALVLSQLDSAHRVSRLNDAPMRLAVPLRSTRPQMERAVIAGLARRSQWTALMIEARHV